jgi:hypothetical protein
LRSARNRRDYKTNGGMTDDAKKRLRHLSTRNTPSDRRIPISRLERYGRLENDVIKAGEEIKSLSRFVGAQRTGFRKLLKKYKKWTGALHLEERVRREILDDPKSFTQYDLRPLLEDYSGTLNDIRTLFNTRLQQSTSDTTNTQAETTTKESSTIARLQASLSAGSRTDFDTTLATSPLGSTGTFASYFVHHDNVVELQVLLLQHLRYFMRSSTSANGTPVPPSSRNGHEEPDCFNLAADCPDRFIQEQSALTVDEREHLPGSTPQWTKLCARWNSGDDALVAARSGSSKMSTFRLKPKHVDDFFDKSGPFLPRRESMRGSATELSDVRDVLTSDDAVRALYTLQCNRSRFVSIANSTNSTTLASLDTNISFAAAGASENRTNFPFAVLWVRQEGTGDSSLLNTLNASHLVERVRGFSMEYHTIWHLFKPSTVAAPFWITMLSRDIRKLPPALPKRTSSNSATESNSPVNGAAVASTGSSVMGTTDGTTTAVGTSRNTSMGNGDSEVPAPPLRAFRNKRRREYPEATSQPQAKYWSEYDHPEDGSDAGDAYVIYIDPNERSSISIFFEKLSKVFSRKPKDEDENLLSPTTTHDDESSSDEDARLLSARTPKSYGSIGSRPNLQHRQSQSIYVQPYDNSQLIPQFAAVSLVASLVILVVAYLLAATGRHKLATEVDAGVIFAIVSSLVFAIVGVAALWREKDLGWISWGVACGVLLIDAVGSGGLLAWLLG